MKKRLVQTIVEEGVNYGQVSHPQDLMKAQDFLHNRISDLTRDFLNNQKVAEVTGFSYSLGAGNAFNITISKPGRVYAQSGESYELLNDTTLTIAPSDEDFPRLDLVVAVLEENVDAELSLIPFVRLRSAEEFGEGSPPYPPQNINAPTEKHNRAVIVMKTGTPAAVPSPPTVDANEIPLYLIAVGTGATQARSADVLDIRQVAFTVRQLNQVTAGNTRNIASLLRRVENLEYLIDQPIDLSHVFGKIRSLGDILSSLAQQLRAVRELPDIRFPHPKVSPIDPEYSQIPASGNTTDSFTPVPVVDVEIGGRINFSGTEVILRPDQFEDEELEAQLIKVSNNPETVIEQTALNLGAVTQTAADGFTDFVERSAEFAARRSRPAAAARNEQFIEIFGGLAPNNETKLGDWLTYDIVNDTLTPRDPSITLPVADRPIAIPFGDGTHILLGMASESIDEPRWFKVNADSGVVTEILSARPNGDQFIGDLISEGKIFLVTANRLNDVGTKFWEYDVSTNEFTEIGVTGSVPELEIDFAGGCCYQRDQFVLVKFTPQVSASGETYIFDRPSAVWTKIEIAGPYADAVDKQMPISRFGIANVNGRPLLVGGVITKETDPLTARIWELQTQTAFHGRDVRKWVAWNATFSPVQDAGFCSTLGGDGLPTGLAALFAGQGKFADTKAGIFASVQGGLIATTYKGQPAITLADTSSFAQFIIPVYEAPWAVASYLLTPLGEYDEGNLQAEVSFDGENYLKVQLNQLFLVQDSPDPGIRSIRITMYNYKTSKPIIYGLLETFDEDGADLENRVVLRYIAPAVESALYVHSDGRITLEEAIVPSTPDKCLLHKVTPGSPPTVKNYINRRRPRLKYTGVEGIDSTFENELAVEVRYVDARAVSTTDQMLYKIADPEIEFDGSINVTGVESGDTWIVEVEG